MHLQDSKTRESVRPIGSCALRILQAIQNRNLAGEYVFPAERISNRPFGGLPKGYGRIVRHKALPTTDRETLADLTLHGLRHGLATTADNLGLTLPTVSALLGHSVSGVTASYIARVDMVLVAAADKVSEEVTRMMGGLNLDGAGASPPHRTKARKNSIHPPVCFGTQKIVLQSAWQ